MHLWRISFELLCGRFYDFLGNPFYCGLIVHNALDGLVVKGEPGEEHAALAKKLAEMADRLSDLKDCVDKMIEYAANLATVWDSSDYSEKQKLQYSVFPEGILYNRKNDECRTPRVNEVFRQMTGLARVLREKENGNNTFDCNVPALVESAGIEPASKHIRRKLSTCLFTHCFVGTLPGAQLTSLVLIRCYFGTHSQKP